jgi:hypothetical protein
MSWLLCHPQKGRPLGKVMKMSVRWETFFVWHICFPFPSFLGNIMNVWFSPASFLISNCKHSFEENLETHKLCQPWVLCLLSFLLTYLHTPALYISFVVFQDHHWLFSGFIRIQCLSSNLSPLATTPLAAQLCTLEISSFIPKSLELGNGNADPQNRDWGGRC